MFWLMVLEVSGWVSWSIIPGCNGAIQHGGNAWWGLLHLTAVREQKREAGRGYKAHIPFRAFSPST